MRKTPALVLISLWLIFLPTALTIYFDLESGKELCLHEEFLDEQTVKGSYDVVANGASVSLVVKDPDTSVVVSKSSITTNGSFAFHTGGKAGVYTFCFSASGSGSVPARLGLSHEIALEKLENAAKKASFTAFEAKLFEIEEKVVQLNRDLRYMRRREAEMRDTSESINNRLVLFSFASSIIITLSGIWQIVYLKRYFQKKKLI